MSLIGRVSKMNQTQFCIIVFEEGEEAYLKNDRS